MSDKLLAEWFWIDRWDGSSAVLLPMEAQGVYRAMLSQAWRRGAALPNDHEAIQRAIRCTGPEWARSWPLIEKYWKVDGTNLVNSTQVEVYTEAMAVKKRASDRSGKAAQASAQARAQARAQAATQATTQAPLKLKLKTSPPSPSPSPSPVSVSVSDSDSKSKDGETDLSAKEADVLFGGAAPMSLGELNRPRRDPRPIQTAKVAEIFAYWIHVMGKDPSGTLLTTKRDKAVRERLNQTYGVDVIKLAIDGCRLDPFNMGQNPAGKKYNDLELICRTGENVERFRDLALDGGPRPAPPGNGKARTAAQTTVNAMREILADEEAKRDRQSGIHRVSGEAGVAVEQARGETTPRRLPRGPE